MCIPIIGYTVAEPTRLTDFEAGPRGTVTDEGELLWPPPVAVNRCRAGTWDNDSRLMEDAAALSLPRLMEDAAALSLFVPLPAHML